MQCVTISLATPPGTSGGAPADAAAFADALFEAGALVVSLTPPDAPSSSPTPHAAASVDGPAGPGAALAGGGDGGVVGDVTPIYHEVPPGAVTWATPPRKVWPAASIDATFSAGVDIADVLARLATAEGLPAPPRYTVRPVDSRRDWVAEVQAGFPPVRVGRLLICYPWHGPDAAGAGRGDGGGREAGVAAEGESRSDDAAGPTVVLPIEPGCAFGTGEHPTTRLVLGFLQTPAAAIAGARVLDYGCGSGVLALAAAALGAASVVGVDIDPDAVAVAVANAAGGGGGGGGDDDDGGAPPPWATTALSFVTVADEPAATAAYDVVVANILAAPLIALAPLLRDRAVLGGRLALAGVLAPQAPAVRDAYEAAGWAVAAAEVIDGWVLLTGVAR